LEEYEKEGVFSNPENETFKVELQKYEENSKVKDKCIH